jgi:diamine N-acetyltransferase
MNLQLGAPKLGHSNSSCQASCRQITEEALHPRRGYARPHDAVQASHTAIRHAAGVDSLPRHVSLREVTGASRSEVELLRVTSDQEHYVAGVAESLLEAAATPRACPWYRAVYARGEPVGFVMISDGIPEGYPVYLGPYFLWRLLIDARRQGQGFGTAALDLVVDYLRTRPGCDTLLTSVVPGPASPVGFYLRYGFSRTGQVFAGEDVLALRLTV